jgi:hypothetical protein|nr:MAG TPA: hypothetical protein [Caudoviricetes sp.]
MAKYTDLSLVVDVEPEVCEVLPLIEDDDLQYEFWQRMDEDFFRVFVEDYCKDSDIRIIKKIIDEVCQEESEED